MLAWDVRPWVPTLEEKWGALGVGLKNVSRFQPPAPATPWPRKRRMRGYTIPGTCGSSILWRSVWQVHLWQGNSDSLNTEFRFSHWLDPQHPTPPSTSPKPKIMCCVYFFLSQVCETLPTSRNSPSGELIFTSLVSVFCLFCFVFKNQSRSPVLDDIWWPTFVKNVSFALFDSESLVTPSHSPQVSVEWNFLPSSSLSHHSSRTQMPRRGWAPTNISHRACSEASCFRLSPSSVSWSQKRKYLPRRIPCGSSGPNS